MIDPPILYTAAGCDESPRVRRWLTERGVAFVERNVGDDADAAQALLATGTFATPLLVVGDTTVLGFRPDRIAAALGRRGADAGAV
jgi:glutaredoxin